MMIHEVLQTDDFFDANERVGIVDKDGVVRGGGEIYIPHRIKNVEKNAESNNRPDTFCECGVLITFRA